VNYHLKWHPNVVVAAVVCKNQNGVDKFLLVRENTKDGIRINQPAGHWEAGESLIDAVKRETFEETGYHFFPQFILGFYIIDNSQEQKTFFRIAFGGEVSANPENHQLDQEIIETMWWDLNTINKNQNLHRSKLVKKVIEDFYHNQRLPLSIIYDLRNI